MTKMHEGDPKDGKRTLWKQLCILLEEGVLDRDEVSLYGFYSHFFVERCMKMVNQVDDDAIMEEKYIGIVRTTCNATRQAVWTHS